MLSKIIEFSIRKLFLVSVRMIPSNKASIILVNNVRSKLLWSVDALDGKRFLYWFGCQYILDSWCSNFPWNCTPSIDQFLFRRGRHGIALYHHNQQGWTAEPDLCISDLNCLSLQPFSGNLYVYWTAETAKIGALCYFLFTSEL